jgi:hypothetical protein
MTIEDSEGIFTHQHPCAIVGEIRVRTDIVLVLDFNDICHKVPARLAKNAGRRRCYSG